MLEQTLAIAFAFLLTSVLFLMRQTAQKEDRKCGLIGGGRYEFWNPRGFR